VTDVVPPSLIDQAQLPFLSERYRQRLRAAIVALNLALSSPGSGGIPIGGTLGQFIRKKSAVDYDIEWATPAISEISGLTAALAAKADLASPALTGVPTAPTAAPGTNSTQISTTAFVQAAIAALVDSSPGTLDTLNELAAALGDDPNFATTISTALGLKAPLASPALTGTPTAPTAAPGTNSTQLATTAFVAAAAALLAPLASAALTGTPTAPTAAPGTNTTQLATTAFVAAAAALLAPLASPALTGTPTAPTAAPGTNSTQLATTAFVAALGALKASLTGAAFTGASSADTGGGVASSTFAWQIRNSTSYYLGFLGRAGSGAYNGIVQADDRVIAGMGTAAGVSALTLTTWSATACGVRIDATGVSVAGTTFTCAARADFTGGGIRASGNSSFTAGTGVEIYWTGAAGAILCYDSTGAAYKPIQVIGLNVDLRVAAGVRISVDATGIGFFGATPAAKPTVTGSRGGNAALASLLTALASLGLLTDSSTP
jgi:hypothetical protein